MQKKQLIILLILSVSGYAWSQTRLAKPELYFGLSGGATASQIGFNPTVRQDLYTGINGGALIRYVSDTYVGLQGEINFSQMGWLEEATNFSRRLNYVEMPFLTHIYIGKKIRFIVNLGPQISYLLSESASAVPENSDDEQHIKTIQNKFDYGFALGLGFLVPISKNIFQLELRGYYGMGDVYSNSKRDYYARSNNLKASVNFSWLLQVK